MKDKLVLCLSDKVEFDNSHFGNTLKEIAEKDWLLSEGEKDIKGIVEKYTLLITEKYLSESEETSTRLEQEELDIDDVAKIQYYIATAYWVCTKKIRKLGE